MDSTVRHVLLQFAAQMDHYATEDANGFFEVGPMYSPLVRAVSRQSLDESVGRYVDGYRSNHWSVYKFLSA